MDPYEKYDMIFNGAAPTRVLTTSPGKYSGQDNGWALALLGPVLIDFDKSVMKFPNIKRFVGGASTDLVPNLQNPDNPVPLLKQQIEGHRRAAYRRRRRLIVGSLATKQGVSGRPCSRAQTREGSSYERNETVQSYAVRLWTASSRHSSRCRTAPSQAPAGSPSSC